MAGSGRAKSCFLPGLKTCARPCDCCSAEAALFFCRPDASFMCLACDAWVHGGGDCAAAAHERVWICDVCGQAPASVTCKADAAALCATCDRDIHSANTLARRHEREAVIPILAAFSSSLLPPPSENGDLECPIPDSWIFPPDDPATVKPELLFADCDQFLDFDSYQISQSQPLNDSLVPVQENPFEIDFTTSNKINFHSSSFNTSSLSHSVSSSSLDVGTVPDGSGASETSHTFSRSLSSIDRTASQGSPAVGMDREARVLRYKEKRKNRKFEKTIRYASRKAYAERRPRIKGRFAKRTDSEQDMYSIFRASTGGHFTVPMT